MTDIIRLGRVEEPHEEHVKLDQYDRKILFYLSQDSRMPLSSLAKKIQMSRDTLHYRIQRLLKLGIIQRFTPIIDLTAFGFSTYHVFMMLNEGTEERMNLLVKTLQAHPHTKSLMEYTGNWELEWVLIAKSVQEFDQIFDKVTTQFSDMILEKQKVEIIKGYKSEQIPKTLYTEQILDSKKKKEPTPLDSQDITLLKSLAEDARKSSYDIAKELKIAPNTARYRMKHLQDTQVIRKFSFVANLAALDYHWYSVSIKLKTMTAQDEKKLKTFVNDHPYILRAVKVLGPFDLLLNIATGSIRDFHKSIKEFQAMFAGIMVSYQSLIGYKEHVFDNLPDAVKI